MAQQNPIGTVVANYDVGQGRGMDDSFFPDIERLDREARVKNRNAMILRRGMQAGWAVAGAIVLAVATYVLRRNRARV